MHFHAQYFSNHFPSLTALKPATKTQFNPHKPHPFLKFSSSAVKCSISTILESTHVELRSVKPFPAEISRTIMELSSVGTLSTLTQNGWPLGTGVDFAVDQEGTPILWSNDPSWKFFSDKRFSLRVQISVACELLCARYKAALTNDKMIVKLTSAWKKRFCEEVNEDFLYVVNVEKILQMEDFMEVCLSTFPTTKPPMPTLFAQKLVAETNTNNIEDVDRFCNVYVDLDFQVSKAKLVWVDRLGFDMRVSSPEKGIVEIRIPLLREVADEKGAKSACMSQLAREMEKNFHPPDFHKVKQFKLISHSTEVYANSCKRLFL